MKNINDAIKDLPPQTVAKMEQRAAQLRQQFAPILFETHLTPELARKLLAFALESGCSTETIIAESLRAYLGDI